MIRGQAFWAFVLVFGMLLLMIAVAFARARAPVLSDVSLVLGFELLYALAMGAGCVRIQRRLGALRGQADEKSVTYISQSVYCLVVLFYVLLIVLMSHMRGL